MSDSSLPRPLEDDRNPVSIGTPGPFPHFLTAVTRAGQPMARPHLTTHPPLLGSAVSTRAHPWAPSDETQAISGPPAPPRTSRDSAHSCIPVHRRGRRPQERPVAARPPVQPHDPRHLRPPLVRRPPHQRRTTPRHDDRGRVGDERGADGSRRRRLRWASL